MGIRIRLPGIFLVVIGAVAALYLLFYRQAWTWVEMGVVVAVIAIREHLPVLVPIVGGREPLVAAEHGHSHA